MGADAKMERQLLDGVKLKEFGNCKIIEIKHFSEELKLKIKDEIRVICHGEYALSSESIFYSFDETVAELIERLPSERIKKVGSIGELILNVLIRILDDLRIVSPFFNLEERNVKKGFDIIAIDRSEDIWIIESKAGELGKMSNVSEKISERINTANRDLKERLNDKNAQLWLNAINSVRSSLDSNDEQKVVVSILEKTSNTSISTDKNVLLGGLVFCSYESMIEVERIKSIYKNISEQELYSKLQIIAIQKGTFEAIIDFLNSLVVKEVIG